MEIYADCDALPRALKTVLQTVADREHIVTYFVAAYAPRMDLSPFKKAIGAGDAFDGADNWIVEHVHAYDLVITADIPLAGRALEKGAEVLGTKGSFFTPSNISNALAMRELMDELRTIGEVKGGPAPFSDRMRIDFINALNRYIQRRKNAKT